jgi:hypothetical protein
VLLFRTILLILKQEGKLDKKNIENAFISFMKVMHENGARF